MRFVVKETLNSDKREYELFARSNKAAKQLATRNRWSSSSILELSELSGRALAVKKGPLMWEDKE